MLEYPETRKILPVPLVRPTNIAIANLLSLRPIAVFFIIISHHFFIYPRILQIPKEDSNFPRSMVLRLSFPHSRAVINLLSVALMTCLLIINTEFLLRSRSEVTNSEVWVRLGCDSMPSVILRRAPGPPPDLQPSSTQVYTTTTSHCHFA